MDRDKLRHKMAYEIANNCFPTPPHEQGWAYKIADSILSLLAPELEKARLWDVVQDLAKRNNTEGYPCENCPVYNECDTTITLCGDADSLVDALSKEAT